MSETIQEAMRRIRHATYADNDEKTTVVEIRAALRQADELITELKTELSKRDWISVVEQPPEEGWVLVWVDYSKMAHPAYWNGEDFRFAGLAITSEWWTNMLPAPPK